MNECAFIQDDRSTKHYPKKILRISNSRQIWGAVGGSVPCSRVSPQSWTIPAEAEI